MTLRRTGEVHLLHGYRSRRSSSGRWPLELVPLGVVPFRGILLGMGGQGLAVPLPPGHVHGSDSATCSCPCSTSAPASRSVAWPLVPLRACAGRLLRRSDPAVQRPPHAPRQRSRWLRRCNGAGTEQERPLIREIGP